MPEQIGVFIFRGANYDKPCAPARGIQKVFYAIELKLCLFILLSLQMDEE